MLSNELFLTFLQKEDALQTRLLLAPLQTFVGEVIKQHEEISAFQKEGQSNQ